MPMDNSDKLLYVKIKVSQPDESAWAGCGRASGPIRGMRGSKTFKYFGKRKQS